MTPALLLELREEKALELEWLALPMDKLAYTYVNMHRDPGGKDENGLERPPAELQPFETFRTLYSLRSRNLAAKPGESTREWDYSLLGANADKAKFEAWAGSKVGAVFIPTKED